MPRSGLCVIAMVSILHAQSPFVSGILVSLDGFADMRVLLCHSNTIVCAVFVTGHASPHLVAYNTEKRSSLWHIDTRDRVREAVSAGDDQFYFIDAATLHRCRLTDGASLEAIDLEKLEWPPRDDILSRKRRELKRPDLSDPEKEGLELELELLQRHLR